MHDKINLTFLKFINYGNYTFIHLFANNSCYFFCNLVYSIFRYTADSKYLCLGDARVHLQGGPARGGRERQDIREKGDRIQTRRTR